MAKPKDTATAFAIHTAVAIALFAGIGFTISALVASSAGTQQTAKAKSPLEVQVASAREIREALARPMPGPEPLPPISSKVNKPTVKVAEAKAEPPPKPKRSRIARQAREAFASIEPFQQQPPFFQFVAFGPARR